MRLPAGVLACCLVLAGCGGGASTAGAPTSDAAGVVTAASTSSTTAPTSSTTAAPASTSSASSTVPVDERRAALIDAALKQYGSPGVVALVRDAAGTWVHASGDADTAGTPIDPGMTFRAASITKPVVAAMALALAAKGTVDLDVPVAPALRPGVLRPDPPVTLRQLLAHTAGVFDEGNEGDPVADVAAIADPALREEGTAALGATMADESVVVPAEVVVAGAEVHDRYNEPGAGYHYSNAGYQAAALYLEAVTGRPLAELVRDLVTEPLGLGRTTLAPSDPSPPEIRGYETESITGNRVDVTGDLRAFGNGGNGGLKTTAADLAAFFVALVRAQLFPADLLAVMERPTAVSSRAGSAYGLGLGAYVLSCGQFYGHEGGVDGTASIALVDPGGERAAVIVFNQRGQGDPRLPQLADYLLCMD